MVFCVKPLRGPFTQNMFLYLKFVILSSVMKKKARSRDALFLQIEQFLTWVCLECRVNAWDTKDVNMMVKHVRLAWLHRKTAVGIQKRILWECPFIFPYQVYLSILCLNFLILIFLFVATCTVVKYRKVFLELDFSHFSHVFSCCLQQDLYLFVDRALLPWKHL